MIYAEGEKRTVEPRTVRSGGSVRAGTGGSTAGLPNSLMSQMIEEDFGRKFSSEAVIRREMSGPIRQIPDAEAEADRLSAGVRGSSPGDIRREMGRRLGADFSGVRFHSGSGSEARGSQMGARAWTRGSDIFFGKGGFDPQIAAHELVHTIQQGAVSGPVRNFAPAGAIQMWPWSKSKTEARKQHINTLANRYRASLGNGKDKTKPADKSSDGSEIEFVLEGLEAPGGKKDPVLGNDLVNKGMSEKDEPDILDNLINNNLPEKDESMSAPEENVPNDLLAVSGKNGPESQENIDGLDTIELGGMDKVNQQEQNEILKDFVSISGRSESDLSSNSEREAAVSDVKDFSEKLGFTRSINMGSNSAAQLGMLAKNHSAMDAQNLYTQAINPAVGAVADVMGVGAGLAGLGTGAFDTYKNFKRLKSGGEKSDIAISALDTIASGTGMVSGGIGTMSKIGSIPGGLLKSVSDFTGSHTSLVPGLNIATGGATALSGGIQSIKGIKSIGKIDEQIKAMEKVRKKKGLDQNQEELLRTFRQGRRISEFNRTSGALKALSGSITAGTGIAALLTGPLAPLTAALAGIAGVATGIGKFIYDKVKKKRMRSDITAEDMGIDWASEMSRVRNMFPGEKLKDKEVRAIILKGHGFSEGTRTAAYKEITKRRALNLMQTAQGVGNDAVMAQKVISALGVHRRGGRYAKGALKLLTKKLG